jgi:hypothetical protein
MGSQRGQNVAESVIFLNHILLRRYRFVRGLDTQSQRPHDAGSRRRRLHNGYVVPARLFRIIHRLS